MPLFVADCREAFGPYIRLTKELQLTLQVLIEISDGGIETRIRLRTIELRRSIDRPFVPFVQTGADSLSLSHSWV